MNINNHRPKILVTNDDGVRAKGIKILTEIAKEFGDITVVAPDGPRSGMSNAITVQDPIRLKLVHEEEGLRVYRCSGTPVDCVKLALNQLYDERPDFVLSGINHGPNSSISLLYSGTMGAAIEGCLHNIVSAGFSLCSYSSDADFSQAKPFVRKVLAELISNGLPQGVCLNVNIPEGEPVGIKVCRQGKGLWVEEFQKRQDPVGRDYYWLTGYYENHEPGAEDSDIHALDNKYVSVVPVTVDMTSYEMLDKLNGWSLNNVEVKKI
ncbi:5'/3'-nucleotidase SurE [Puteibacter caeruleilacunae]|nr:5'/3'-nucleotidase SurE [Puteibacter caeruleilacunae]